MLDYTPSKGMSGSAETSLECIFLGCFNTAFHMNKEEKNWKDEKKKKKPRCIYNRMVKVENTVLGHSTFSGDTHVCKNTFSWV